MFENNKQTDNLRKQQAAASTTFWRSAAFTAASVLVFTVSAIALDVGMPAVEASTLQVVATLGAITSIGGAAFAQVASRRIDKIEEELESARQAEIERTTTIEVAPSKEHEKGGPQITKQKAREVQPASSSISSKHHTGAIGRDEPSPGRGVPHAGRR